MWMHMEIRAAEWPQPQCCGHTAVGRVPQKDSHSSVGVCLHVRTAASAHDLQPKSPAHPSLLVLTTERRSPFFGG
ncbi:hypothetical protein Nmel_018087 [Mimus melanotis]